MITVYSAICGEKDHPRDDVLCFNAYDRFRNPRLNAKIYKVLSHQFVDSEYSIWIDGNMRLLVPPEELVEMMGDADCAVFRHPERDNIWDEADIIIERQKDNSIPVREQMVAYRRTTFRKKDLGMCGLIVRRHTEEIIQRNERWWSEICRFSVRDQLSFPIVFDGAVRYFDSIPLTGGRFFSRAKHQK